MRPCKSSRFLSRPLMGSDDILCFLSKDTGLVPCRLQSAHAKSILIVVTWKRFGCGRNI